MNKILKNKRIAMLTLNQVQLIDLAKSYSNFLSACIKRGTARKKALGMDKQL